MPATLTREGDKLVLDLSTCRGGEFRDALDKVRDIPGRSYDGAKKLWSVPASPYNADRILKSIEPDTDEGIVAWIREEMKSAEETLTTPIPEDSPARLMVPWAYERMSWQPAVVNDE